jgi:hypothetical protein
LYTSLERAGPGNSIANDEPVRFKSSYARNLGLFITCGTACLVFTVKSFSRNLYGFSTVHWLQRMNDVTLSLCKFVIFAFPLFTVADR